MPRIHPAVGLLASIAPLGAYLLTPQTPTKPVSYRSVIEPLFKSQCISCHQPNNRLGGLDLTTAEGIRKGGVSGSMLSGKNSILVQRLRGEGGKPRMPMGFAPVAEATIKQVELWVAQGAPIPSASIRFDRDIAPVFKANCLSCHTGAAGAGGLDLSTPAGIAKGGASGALFDTRQPEKSLLIERLLGHGGKPRMPMGFAPLDASTIDKIKGWIAGGAETTDEGEHTHWSFLPPKRPQVPNLGSSWVRNPIDAFVLEKIKSKKWSPAPTASKETLLRRLYLDLVGLPPTPAEVDLYLKDTRPDAYERAVDRLLDSPHYGENMARKWLDLARYADSDGFEKDLQRTAWLYRDWVINAFNRDLPYDEFIVEQVAGDLLKDATLDQRVATGFNRNTMQNLEGGVDQEEAHFAKLIDRVATTSTVVTGLTLACAQCHDHKYDPLSAKDYYKFMAFFSNTKIYPRGNAAVSEEKWYEAEIPVPTREQNTKLAELKAVLARLEGKLAEPIDEADFARWQAAVGQREDGDALRPVTEQLKIQGSDVRYEGKTPDNAEYVLAGRSAQPVTGFRLNVVPDPSQPNGGSGLSPAGNFIVSDIKVVAGSTVEISDLQASYTQSDFDVKDVLDDQGDTGWAIAPHFSKPHELVFELAKPIPANTEYRVTLGMRSKQWPQHVLGRFRLAALHRLQPIQYVLPMGSNPQDSSALRKLYAQLAPSRRVSVKQLKQVQSEKSQIERSVPTAMVMEELKNGVPRIQFRERGEFLQKGAWVTADTPKVLPPMKPGLPKNRLGLARWLTMPNHPLTARVQVNRLWEHLFGRGIVETSENFGTQASPPTHPELLDWLATEFVRLGWSNKQMLKLIVTSATYRQSSVASAKLREADPNNEYLARGPRYRLDAETLRDNALRISGLLSDKIGGPSVYPVQPEGIWNTPYSGERWMTAGDENRYRRGLYTFWKRTAPYPSFMAFDATSREQCTVRRIRTNTPLQALAMLNDPAYLEAARALATIMKRAGADPNQQVVAGFRRCTGRMPTAAERARLVKLAVDLRKRYQNDPEAAAKLGDSAEVSALVMVANVLLNLDETLTKE